MMETIDVKITKIHSAGKYHIVAFRETKEGGLEQVQFDDGEPLFLLRGNDNLAYNVVKQYYVSARNNLNVGPKFVSTLIEVLHAFKTWKETSGKPSFPIKTAFLGLS